MKGDSGILPDRGEVMQRIPNPRILHFPPLIVRFREFPIPSTPPKPMMIGKSLSHYTITEQIGSGGMGVVYKAQDTRLNRPVALKFLPPELIRDAVAKERFMREAHTISALDHPNICTLFEIEETPQGQTFMAMAYYEGETLSAKIKRGPLKVEEAVKLLIQVCDGLSHAHAKGIVHRDIKPANIAVTKDGIVKILDFGLAKLATSSRLTRSGSTAGTASYMSPEQARGDNVDHRSDIWSLGVVLFEALTGTLPFKGEFEHAVVYSILNEQPSDLDRFCPDLPPSLQPIVTRALQKDPADRYQSVEEMANDLREAVSPTGTSTSLFTALPTLRRRVRSMAFWTLLAIAIVAGALYLIPLRSAPENRIVVLPFETSEENSVTS